MEGRTASELISGGARGADSVFARYARDAGHRLQIVGPRARIDAGDAKDCHESLAEVNERYLRRTYPTHSASVDRLLQRNAKIGLSADRIYAVGYLDRNDGRIAGGTAWACYVFANKLRKAGTRGEIALHLFDQADGRWKTAALAGDGALGWRILDEGQRPPNPCGDDPCAYAGVGSRQLTEAGEKAIVSLFR